MPKGDIPELGLDYSAGESVAMDVAFRSDWWEENIV
jgi:hypothetical protein